MNTTLLTIIIVISGIAAAIQFYSLARRVYRLESNLNLLLTTIEKAIDESKKSEKK